MEKRISTSSIPNILVHDDNALTAFLVLRLFRYLGCNVRYVDNKNHVNELNCSDTFNLVLINLTNAHQSFECALSYRYFNQEVPVLYYISDILINDFKQAEQSVATKCVDDSWMMHSDLFRYLTDIIRILAKRTESLYSSQCSIMTAEV